MCINDESMNGLLCFRFVLVLVLGILDLFASMHALTRTQTKHQTPLLSSIRLRFISFTILFCFVCSLHIITYFRYKSFRSHKCVYRLLVHKVYSTSPVYVHMVRLLMLVLLLSMPFLNLVFFFISSVNTNSS